MPLAQLQQYEAYTQQHGLPLWRVEMQLARIAMLLDGIRIGPGAQLRLEDYLFSGSPDAPPPAPEPPAQEQPTPEQADALLAAIEFKPRNRRHKPPAAP